MRLMSHAKEMALSIIANQQVKIKSIDEGIKITDAPVEQVYNLSFDVTDQIREIYKQTDYLPWTSFDLTNVGPNPVYFCVNKWLSSEAPLPVGQSINVDFKKKGAITKLYLKCDRGNTAKVMLYIVK